MSKLTLLSFVTVLITLVACGEKPQKADEYIKADVYNTNGGPLKVTLIGHSSIMFEYAEKIIHVDPYSKVADYSKLPKADLIMITHEHQDHLDVAALNLIKKDSTHIFSSKVAREILGYGNFLENEEITLWEIPNIGIEAVPAYNIVNKKPDGEAYHPKGRGNGYIFYFGDKKVYVAGDTENIPEMDRLTGSVDIAFLPKNLPYTMSDEMFIDAARRIAPKVLYPYHMAEFDQEKISKALRNSEIKLEVRPMSNN